MLDNREYSLWIVPPPEIYSVCKNIINELSDKFSTPIFEPHITLAGDLVLPKNTVLHKTRKIIKEFKPFIVTSSGVDFGTEYFRSVFIKIDQQPSLTNLFQYTQFTLGIEKKIEFKPHISLVYGNFDEDVKREIIAWIGNRCKFEFEVNSVEVVLSSSNIEISQWRRLHNLALQEHPIQSHAR